MQPITTAIFKAIKPFGNLVHEGFQVRCIGNRNEDGTITDSHLIATLNDHLPGTQAHAWGNEEFTDDLWIIDPSQSSIDWNNPVCQICQKTLSGKEII